MSAPRHIKTLILAAIVLGLACIREMALWGSFAIGIATLIYLPWSVYSFVRLVMRPTERRSRAMRLGIWAAVLVVAFGIRAHWDAAAHKEASAAASAIQAHRVRTGSYPTSLSEVGLDAEALSEKISLKYRLNDGQANLFYSQPSMPMIAYHYNFETNSWVSRD